MRKLAILLVPLLVMGLTIGVVGCGDEEEAATPTPTPTATPTPTSTDAPIPEGYYIYENGAIQVGGDGEPIKLVNNPNATNPTYAELLAFLEEDPTDKYSYIVGPPRVAYVCSDFAEDVHNNAEAAGIRAAWVGIDIKNDDEGHALNAFETTDIGLVYVDCTGEGLWDASTRDSWDKAARVEVGQWYVVKDIDKVKSRFEFKVSVYRYIEESRSDEIIEWLQEYSIQELGEEWVQEWMHEHRTELFKCSEELKAEPVQSATVSIKVDHHTEYHLVEQTWRLYVDCREVNWFKPQTEVVVVDEVEVRREVGWWEVDWLYSGRYQFEPLGVVEDIYIHW